MSKKKNQKYLVNSATYQNAALNYLVQLQGQTRDDDTVNPLPPPPPPPPPGDD